MEYHMMIAFGLLMLFVLSIVLIVVEEYIWAIITIFFDLVFAVFALIYFYPSLSAL